MKGCAHILLPVFLLAFSGEISAQVAGNVVVHSDPRLSVLIRKPHNIDDAPAPVIRRKPAVKSARTGEKSAPAVASVSAATGSKTPGTPSPGAPVSTQPSNSPVTVVSSAATNMPASPAAKPLPMENGHVAGWTPPVRKVKVIYSGKGFRVQIYNGPDRQKAISIKTEFMRMNPGVRTYLSYVTPSFRVKVGDYKNRTDAVGMWKEANSVYHPSMIVPDIVTISTF